MIDIFKKDCSRKFSEIFTKSGPLGMFKEADYKNIDLASAFFGEMVDAICGCSYTALVSAVLADYLTPLIVFVNDIPHRGGVKMSSSTCKLKLTSSSRKHRLPLVSIKPSE